MVFLNEKVDYMIRDSGLGQLRELEFEKKSEGRFFQKRPFEPNESERSFYVILEPNVESPVHNHEGEEMTETHLLLYGSGKFEIYDSNGNVDRVLWLERGKSHRPFSTPANTPDHKYIAGPYGSICLAMEVHE